MNDLTKRRAILRKTGGGDIQMLLDTIDSLEELVKEAEAQRDNDRRAVRSLERVKDENATLREALALADELAEAAVVRRPSAFWGTMTLQEPIDGESDFTLIAEADLDRLKSARLAYRSIREGKNALVGLGPVLGTGQSPRFSHGWDREVSAPNESSERCARCGENEFDHIAAICALHPDVGRP